MAGRDAACSCGQLRVTAEGDPFAVSICHCLSCQRRTGSAFGMQAGFRADQVQVAGRYNDYARTSDEQDRKVHVFHFCPECGGTVFCTEPDEADLVVVMAGAFADPAFPPPTRSGYGARRHQWFDLPADIASDEVWAQLQPLYEAGEFAEVADRGRALVAEHPEHPGLLYNLACCESLAGRPGDAIEHLRTAIHLDDEFRPMAAEDADFDPIRDEPAFGDLVGTTREDRMSDYSVARIDEIDELSDGRCPFRPVRKHFGIMSFGVNTWTGKSAGDRIINEHDEAEEHEELYLVQRGRATFELDGERVDAPAGTMVFARPGVKRTAFAEDPDTTIVAIGGTPGEVYEPSGFEVWLPITPLYEAGKYAEAADRGRELINENPEYAGLLYNVACCESLAGRTADAIEHLRLAIERSERFRSFAAGDSDFDPIREQPEFTELVG